MFTLNAQFDAHVDQEETLAAVLEVLPTGTQATLQREPMLLDVPDLNETHVGASVRGNIGMGNEFGGALEALYPAEDTGRLLIVDGKPHTLRNFEVVQVIPPITVGAHEPDVLDVPEEPEVEESFDMAVDDYNAAVELAMHVEESVAPYLQTFGWLTRPMVEQVAQRAVTDEEFVIVASGVIQQMRGTVDTVLGTVVARYLELFEQVYGQEDKNA